MAEGLGFEPSHNGFRDRRATATLTLSMSGAPGRTRTGTGLRPRDFKSLASTYSATGADKGVLGTGRHPWIVYYHSALSALTAPLAVDYQRTKNYT